MMHLARAAAAVTTCLLIAGVGFVAPAQARGAAAFHGTAHINCFGCGGSSGTASLRASGEANGVAKAEGPVTATFSLFEDPNTCPLTGSAIGSFSGAFNGTFTWSRVGATAVITTAGDINGTGIALFQTTTVGLICGAFIPMNATVVGSIAGN
jgi:hypothetical protein